MAASLEAREAKKITEMAASVTVDSSGSYLTLPRQSSSSSLLQFATAKRKGGSDCQYRGGGLAQFNSGFGSGSPQTMIFGFVPIPTEQSKWTQKWNFHNISYFLTTVTMEFVEWLTCQARKTQTHLKIKHCRQEIQSICVMR